MRATENQPLVSDELLTELANPTYRQQCGDFDVETRALLAAALPEISNELLLWRQMAASKPAALAMALRSDSIESRLSDARRVVSTTGAIDPGALGVACQSLMRHSIDVDERAAAAAVLAEMQEAA